MEFFFNWKNSLWWDSDCLYWTSLSPLETVLRQDYKGRCQQRGGTEEQPQGAGGGAEGEDWALVLPVATPGVGPGVAKWSDFSREAGNTIFFPLWYVFEIQKLHMGSNLLKKKENESIRQNTSVALIMPTDGQCELLL